MKKLSLTDTQSLIDSFVKTYGQNKAARELTKKGFRSPEGAPILQAHIYRILHGSRTCILSPETENQQQEPPTTEEPIAAVPKIQKRLAEELFADEKLLEAEIAKTASELREKLEDERLALEEMERSMPPLVPCTRDCLFNEHRHLERDVRISGVFNLRQPVEFDESGATYFNIPKLRRKPPAIVSRPYQRRNFGRNSLSSRDLSIHQK